MDEPDKILKRVKDAQKASMKAEKEFLNKLELRLRKIENRLTKLEE